MQFTVRNATEARKKLQAFITLFDSEPTGISAIGNFTDETGDILFAPAHQPVKVLELRNRWLTIRDNLNCRYDVYPSDGTFEIIFH